RLPLIHPILRGWSAARVIRAQIDPQRLTGGILEEVRLAREGLTAKVADRSTCKPRRPMLVDDDVMRSDLAGRRRESGDGKDNGDGHSFPHDIHYGVEEVGRRYDDSAHVTRLSSDPCALDRSERRRLDRRVFFRGCGDRWPDPR